MIKTVGVCGYGSTGSSAFIDLLHEFDETQVLDMEFLITHFPDGLEDLEYNLQRSRYSAPVAMRRFKKLVEARIPRKKGRDEATNEFLDKIIQLSWKGGSPLLEIYFSSSTLRFIKKKMRAFLRRARLSGLLRKNMEKLFFYKLDFSIMPENLDEASKFFIADVLKAMGINYNDKEKEIIVLNQPFLSRDPLNSFKFFENPSAIIVDRDPRDNYLFFKYFLFQKAGLGAVPLHNVDDYIKHYRLLRQSSQDLWKRKDVIRFNFEELVYDCENTVTKVTDFVGVAKRSHKGEFFKPTHSRNNTQLFKRYPECKSEIKKIEQELKEYIFPFEKYPDIEPEGGMFYGSQLSKQR